MAKRKFTSCQSISCYALTIATNVAAGGTIVHVDQNATGLVRDGSTWCTAFTDLRDALDLAVPGTTIRVADGTYTPDRGTGDRAATFHLKNDVRVEGGFAGCGAESPDARNTDLFETILSGDLNGDDGGEFVGSGENSYHVVTGSGTDDSAVLDGFTVTAGNAVDAKVAHGGGMFNQTGSPTVVNCTFVANVASKGGGMGNFLESNPTLRGCLFLANRARSGGGMSNDVRCRPTLLDCTFSENVADAGWMSIGGGMMNRGESAATVINCVFRENYTSGEGGAVHSSYDAASVFVGCIFVHNMAGQGGGAVYSTNSSIMIYNSTFGQNTAGMFGGGIWSDHNNVIELNNVVFRGNQARLGGAISNIASEIKVTNCTLVGNLAIALGGGIHNWISADVAIANSILWNNSDVGGNNESAQVFNSDDGVPSFISIDHSCVQGWLGTFGGVGNIGDNPKFVDQDNGDFRLLNASPCANAGDNNALPLDLADLDHDGDTSEFLPVDIDRLPRVVAGTVDMGAHESQHVPIPAISAWGLVIALLLILTVNRVKNVRA